MPEMDGIEFITQVRTLNISKAHFVFLSGFYDFQYAKTAIQYGCSDYILKPIQKEELLVTIRRIREEFRKEAGKEKNKVDYEKAYLDRHLLAILWGKYDSVNVKYVQGKMQFSCEIFYIHCELSLNDDNFLALSEEKRREVQRRLYQYTTLLLKKYADHIIYDITKYTECYDIGIIYGAFMAKERGVSQEEWLEWLIQELTERIGYEVEAFAGSKVHSIEAISDSYREAILLRSFRYYKKHGFNNRKLCCKEDNVKNQKDVSYKKQLDELVYVIEINDKLRIREYAKAIYRSLMDKKTASDTVSKNIQYLLYRLLGLAYNQDTEINQEDIMQYIRDAVFTSKASCGNELKFQQFVEEYADYLAQLRQNTAKGTIKLIEAEIEENYAENLSLKYLGEKYYINSAYLGQLFKKQYGCSFKDYLNDVRTRKAAEMVLRTDKKVYEIAAEVGYKNLEYFINKFEELYGMTPTRFRKRNLQNQS
jgi:two-component system response regulator YesN